MKQKRISVVENNRAGNFGKHRVAGLATRSNIFFLTILLVIISVYLLLSHNQAIYARLESVSTDLIIWLTGWGIVGAFLVTLVANTSVMVQIPYPLLFTFLAGQAEEVSYLVIITVVGALGGTLGEMISYFIGQSISKSGFFGDRLKASIHRIVTDRSRLIGPLAFLFAATPIPDDLLLVPLGLSNYGFRRILLPIFLGKGIVLGALVYVSYNAKVILTEITVGSPVDPTFLPLLMVIMMAFIVFQAHKARSRPDETYDHGLEATA